MYLHHRSLVVLRASRLFWSCGSIEQYSTPQRSAHSVRGRCDLEGRERVEPDEG